MLLLMLSFAAVERHSPVGSGIDTGHRYVYAKHGKRDNNE